MIIFSPSVHEAVDSLNLVARVRIVDDRSPLLARVPIGIPAPAWRPIHADVYPADGYEIRNGMTITSADIDALDSFLNEDPAEPFNRVRLLNADASRRWAHSESIDGYAYPSRHSRKRKRASVHDEAVDFKRTCELFQHDLHRSSRIRTHASYEADSSTPAWTDVYMAEEWYCRGSYVEDVDKYWSTREPEDSKCTSVGFVFATPAVSLGDVNKYRSTIGCELLDGLLDAFESLSISKHIVPLFEQAQSYTEAIFSDFIPHEPDKVDASACRDTVEESKSVFATLDKFIIEISDDETDGDEHDGDRIGEAQDSWHGATPLADKAFIIEAGDDEDEDHDSIPNTDSNEDRSDRIEDKQYNTVSPAVKMHAIELSKYAKVAATKSTNIVEGDDNFFSQPLTPIPGRGRNIITSISAFLDTLSFLRIG